MTLVANANAVANLYRKQRAPLTAEQQPKYRAEKILLGAYVHVGLSYPQRRLEDCSPLPSVLRGKDHIDPIFRKQETC
jgi:hypothetical protein